MALQKDEGYIGVELAWNPLETPGWLAWQDLSVNAFAWWGLSDRDAAGLGFRHTSFPLLIPDFSYAHTFTDPDADTRWFGTAHCDITSGIVNPLVEVGFGASYENGRTANALSAGVAYFPPRGMLPAVHYTGQTGELRWAVDGYPGRTRTTLTSLMTRYFEHSDQVDIELTTDRIVSIAPFDTQFASGWIIDVTDGNDLRVDTSDPHVDCFSCRVEQNLINRFPCAPDARIYWIYELDADGRWSRGNVLPVEVDMKAVLERFERDGVLVIRGDPDIVPKALDRAVRWWRDWSGGVGWFWFDDQD